MASPQWGSKLGLDNTSRLLDHFGNPQLAIPTVHIAGTNGKGSTAAFTESILRASGKKVGLFTSPHLLKFNERIQINRCPISDSELVTLISKVQKAVDRLNVPVTFFEFCTVMAFLHFMKTRRIGMSLKWAWGDGWMLPIYARSRRPSSHRSAWTIRNIWATVWNRSPMKRPVLSRISARYLLILRIRALSMS